MPPAALHNTALVFLLLSLVSAVVIAADVVTVHRQKMMVMNFVWPITALWSGPFGLLAYWMVGRPKGENSRWKSVLVGTSHCGAGCTLGDFAGEWTVFLSGLTLAGSMLWADYAIDFAWAYLVGIVFQYYSIAPTRNLHGWEAIKAALKADTISLVAFEAGMFAWMAVSNALFHGRLKPVDPTYWFMMQIAMLVGFLTGYPANWWLIRKGLKEAV